MPFDRDVIVHWNLDRAEAQAYAGAANVPWTDDVLLGGDLLGRSAKTGRGIWGTRAHAGCNIGPDVAPLATGTPNSRNYGARSIQSRSA